MAKTNSGQFGWGDSLLKSNKGLHIGRQKKRNSKSLLDCTGKSTKQGRKSAIVTSRKNLEKYDNQKESYCGDNRVMEV